MGLRAVRNTVDQLQANSTGVTDEQMGLIETLHGWRREGIEDEVLA